MSRYAGQTEVSPERSQEQIKNTLRRYGCDKFGVMETKESAMILFEIRRMQVRIEVPIPPRADFAQTETGKARKENAIEAAYEQGIKQRWRALLLCIKAKLEAVETGISTIEKEFLPFIVMPDGRVIGDHLIPKLEKYAETGKMPALLTAS